MKWVEQAGYHVTKVEYRSGYYIFGYGTNSVIHYKIKECPDWTFAIWWDLSTENIADNSIIGATFFCEHDKLMDKFKPSACVYVHDYKFHLSDFNKETSDWCFNNYHIGLLKFISKHPMRAFYRTYTGTDFNQGYINSFRIIFKYIDYHWYHYTKVILKSLFERTEVKFIKKNVLKYCDYNDDYKAKLICLGNSWSPKYEIQCRIPDSEPDEERGCFDIFDTREELSPDAKRVKNRWDKLIARHEKISDIFRFFPDRITNQDVIYYRDKDCCEDD